MTLDAALVHGGALDAAVARFGGARAGWLDLSTGINPVAPAMPPIAADAWQRLPEAAAEAELAHAARRFYGAQGAIVAAPGTQALISMWPWLFAPGEAAVIAPTYGEHATALEAAGHRVDLCASLDVVAADARLVVVVNPNNPDGRLHTRQYLLELAVRLRRSGGMLVVDEAFIDAEPAQSLAGDTAQDGILVLKSFGKFFGLAGVRLGFALCAEPLAARLRQRLGPWAVSGPALAAGSALLAREAADGRVSAELARQSALTRQALAQAGLALAGGTAMFNLVHQPDAAALFERLAGRHILTRPFAYRADWLRIGNLRDAAEAGRLVAAVLT